MSKREEKNVCQECEKGENVCPECERIVPDNLTKCHNCHASDYEKIIYLCDLCDKPVEEDPETTVLRHDLFGRVGGERHEVSIKVAQYDYDYGWNSNDKQNLSNLCPEDLTKCLALAIGEARGFREEEINSLVTAVTTTVDNICAGKGKVVGGTI